MVSHVSRTGGARRSGREPGADDDVPFEAQSQALARTRARAINGGGTDTPQPANRRGRSGTSDRPPPPSPHTDHPGQARIPRGPESPRGRGSRLRGAGRCVRQRPPAPGRWLRSQPSPREVKKGSFPSGRSSAPTLYSRGGVYLSSLEYRVDPLRVRVSPCGGRGVRETPPRSSGPFRSSSGRVQVTLGENLNSFACEREGAPAGLSGGGSTVDSPY
jgi:hypothetical protein